MVCEAVSVTELGLRLVPTATVPKSPRSPGFPDSCPPRALHVASATCRFPGRPRHLCRPRRAAAAVTTSSALLHSPAFANALPYAEGDTRLMVFYNPSDEERQGDSVEALWQLEFDALVREEWSDDRRRDLR